MAILFKTNNKEFQLENEQDKTVMDLARRGGIFIKTSCGGKGRCGSCIVNLISGEFLLEDKKIIISEKGPRKALSCITKVLSNDATIEVPPYSIIEVSGEIIDDFFIKHYVSDPQTKKVLLMIPRATLEDQLSDRQRMEGVLRKEIIFKNINIPLDVLKKLPDALLLGNQMITVTMGPVRDQWFMINIEPGDTTQPHFAVAIDVGTTTVVGILVDLIKDEIVGRASLYNQQIKVADDVISRIAYCKTQKEVEFLKDLIIEDTINPILRRLCTEADILPGHISRMSVSGNTIMMHLLLGLNPRSIGQIPFQPVTRVPGAFRAKEMGIDIVGNGIVELVPSVSGYIGSDITSDVWVSNVYKAKELTVLVDIGTNGEIVMSESGNMIACSTAAGPAFEGYGLYHGFRASPGAIDRIFFDEEKNVRFGIIGNDKASGICGTGFIDFIAEGFKIGLINHAGRFNYEFLKRLNLYHTIKEKENTMKACIIAKKEYSQVEGPVIITELDIAKVLQAKAAIYAGLKTLLTIKNRTWSDIRKLVLAGGFAKNINIRNAILIGLLPDIPEECIEVIGNGSLAGAFLSLVEPKASEHMIAISRSIDVVELNLHKDFEQNYLDSLFLPNID